jgi:outer membrane protein assembly factor BamB
MNDEQLAANPDDAGTIAKKKKERRKTSWPGRSFWVLLVFSIAAVVAAGSLNDDPSVSRIVAVMGLLICSFNLLIWFYFRSTYSLRTRRLGMLGLVALTSLTFASVRIESFSGSMIPTFKFVWNQAHDETLGQLATSGDAAVDLMSTSVTDFPQFLGPERNSVVRGVNLASDWTSAPPTERWRREVGAGWSGFSVVNGFAVTMEQRGENELVTCYALDTGEPQWSSSITARHKSGLGFLGPRSTPTIHNGRVYAQGATGILRCLDGADGQEIWRRDFITEQGMTQQEAELLLPWGRSQSPLVFDDKLIVVIGGQAPGKSVNVAALNLETGDTIWEGGTQQISYASPTGGVLGGVPQVVVVNESSVSGHDVQTGEQLWEHPWDAHSNMDANCSQPLIMDDQQHVLVSKGYGGGAELINVAADDDADWDTVTVWANRKALKTKFSNVAIIDGHAYALDDGILCCVDLETGERVWKQGRYRFGQVLGVDDSILVLSEFGKLALVDASPDGWNERGSIEALDGQTWNTLCLSGNKLLVRNAKEAVCYELAQETAP